MNAMTGFAVGMAGWGIILLEIFVGFSSIGKVANASEAVKTSFNLMRMIVTIGWAIYPAGHYFGVLKGKADDQTLNVIYNLADFVNKIMFVCACWSCTNRVGSFQGGFQGWGLSCNTVNLSQLFCYHAVGKI